jgi:hypothetical protein
VVLLTFRLLIGSLYIGLYGERWMLNVAACGVFAIIFGSITMSLPLVRDEHLPDFLNLPDWLPWSLGVLFAGRIAIALILARRAYRQPRCITWKAARYVAFWLSATLLITISIWLLLDIELRQKWVLTLLALFIVPLLRISYAPLALARNISR